MSKGNKFITELVTSFERGEELTYVDIRYLVDHGLICNEGPERTRVLTEKGYSYLPKDSTTISKLREEIEILKESCAVLRRRNELLQSKLDIISTTINTKE